MSPLGAESLNKHTDWLQKEINCMQAAKSLQQHMQVVVTARASPVAPAMLYMCITRQVATVPLTFEFLRLQMINAVTIVISAAVPAATPPQTKIINRFA